jgi:glycosyltransferase involved in cell wall biosynthesis
MELLNSLSIVKGKYGITIPLHICGDGPLRSFVLDYTEHNNLITILHGFVPHPEKFLAKCRYAFVTGYLSILEAMSYKSVVLTIYSNPLKRDYLYSISKAENIMIIASSPEELAENIYCATINPDQTNLISQRAYEFAIQQSWHKLAILYLELYSCIR